MPIHIDANPHLTCPMQENIGEVMPLQTLGVMGAIPGSMLSRAWSRASAPLKLAYLLPHTSTPYPLLEPRPPPHDTT
jgi:hypothetical protein